MITGEDLPFGDGPLVHRPKGQLLHIETVMSRPDPLVIDANSVSAILRERLPLFVRVIILAVADLWMAACTVAEIEHLMARLSPEHPDTFRVVKSFRSVLHRVGSERTLVPTAEEWALAGRLAGAIARRHGGATKQSTPGERIELLNDCLTAVVAVRVGGTVLTNDLDFDLIQQAMPEARVTFFGHTDGD